MVLGTKEGERPERCFLVRQSFAQDRRKTHEDSKRSQWEVVGSQHEWLEIMGLDREALKQKRRERARTPLKGLAKDYLDVLSLPGLTTFVTATFAGASQPTAAVAWRTVHSFQRRLGQMTHGVVPMVAVVEAEEQMKRTHVHLLVAGIDHLPEEAIRQAWKRGNLKIDRPIRGGAPSYLAEKIAEGQAEWDRLPEKFDKALRRVRWLQKKRKREGITLYNSSGLPTNRKWKKKKKPKREVAAAV